MKSELERILNREKVASRFEGKIELEENEILVDPESRRPIETSFLGMNEGELFNNINIKYKPSFEQKRPGKTKLVVQDIGKHEILHNTDARLNYRGCPKNLNNHLRLYEIVGNILFAKKFNQFDVQYMVNIFEDLVVNSLIGSKFDGEGLVRFYEEVGEVDGFTNYYEAFVKLQMSIFGNRGLKNIIGRFYKHEQKVQAVIGDFYERSGLNDFKKVVEINGASQTIRDRKKIINHLADESNWEQLVTVFTEEFSKLIEKNYAHPIPGLGGCGTEGRESEMDGPKGKGEGSGNEDGQPGDGQPGDGQPGDGNNAGNGSPGSNIDSFDDLFGDDAYDKDRDNIKWENLKGGNVFDKQMQNDEIRKSLAWNSFKAGNGVPTYLKSHEALDAVYATLAKKLKIKAQSQTRTTSMTLTRYGTKDYDPKRDAPRHLKYIFDEKGNLSLKRKKYDYDYPLNVKTSFKGFPEVRFVMLDTSSSMADPPGGYSYGRNRDVGNTDFIPWGTKSKYHYALLAWYGLLEYLRKNHLLRKSSVALANFSYNTEVVRGLYKAKRLALKPQFGGTSIHMDQVKNMFEKKGMLIFTLSDGDIQNWYSIKDEFIEYAHKHHYFHLQIGGTSRASKDLDNAGFPVFYVQGEEDLWNQVLDLTDKMYKGKYKKDDKKRTRSRLR